MDLDATFAVGTFVHDDFYMFQGQLSRQGSSVESTTIVPLHHHTAECAGVGGRSLHQPTEHSKVALQNVPYLYLVQY